MGTCAATRPLTLRESVCPEDQRAVMDVAASSGFFSPEEVEMAGSLVEERLRDGEPSGYFFVFAESGAQTAPMAGFACYGPATYAADWVDLYWIAVHQSRRGAGVGSALLERVEQRVRGPRATTLVAETSSRGQYRPTRAFYEHKGFALIAMMKSFYAPGEHKIIYAKRLAPQDRP
jgi:GNAT superfamily N-acetyltransferase